MKQNYQKKNSLVFFCGKLGVTFIEYSWKKCISWHFSVHKQNFTYLWKKCDQYNWSSTYDLSCITYNLNSFFLFYIFMVYKINFFPFKLQFFFSLNTDCYSPVTRMRCTLWASSFFCNNFSRLHLRFPSIFAFALQFSIQYYSKFCTLFSFWS